MRPAKEIRLDYTDHMPEHNNKKEAGRSKLFNYIGKSHFKCNVIVMPK